jgi:hypothetical protein
VRRARVAPNGADEASVSRVVGDGRRKASCRGLAAAGVENAQSLSFMGNKVAILPADRRYSV